LVLLLGGLSALGPISMDLYLPGMPAMADDLSAGWSMTTLTTTACMIGLGLGQVLAGPISDRLGRRPPLLAGIAVYVVMSLLCAVAPSIWVLLVLRLLQGFAGAAGIVVAAAIARDVGGGIRSARLFASLVAIGSIAPVVAPLVGGQLLHVTDWRGTFLAMAAVGVVFLVAAGRVIVETLPADRRRSTGPTLGMADSRLLLGDRRFVALMGCVALSFSTLGLYLGGGPFLLEEIHGVSPQLFSVLFAANAAGIVGLSQASRRLVHRTGPTPLLVLGLATSAAGGTGCLLLTLADAPLGWLLLALFLVVSSMGLVRPNAMALALAPHPSRAGSAAGLMGMSQFCLSAAVMPVVGVGGAGSALPMAGAMCATSVLSPLAFLAGAHATRGRMPRA
jgi:DHA1 family bicyclomycin/chloramphenicol resistance-like MFS transporter